MLLKILFWVYAPLYILLVIFSSQEVNWHIVDWLSIVAIIIALLFLFALAYRKNYFSYTTRKLVFIAITAYMLAYIFFLDPNFGAYPGEEFKDAIVTNIVAVLPVFIPAYLYSTKARKQR